MVTGMLPFRGDTSGIIFEAVLNRPPVSAARLNPDVPAELGAHHQPGAGEGSRPALPARVGDAGGTAAAEARRRFQPGRIHGEWGVVSVGGCADLADSANTDQRQFGRGERGAAEQTGSGGDQRDRTLAGRGCSLWRVRVSLRSRPVPFQNFSVSKITETGKARFVAISPDGKYILNVVEDKGQQGLWLRNVPTNSNTQVMPLEPVQYVGVRFSPDGNYLYFVRGEPGQVLKYLYRAPVLGGTPEKLVTDVDTNITFFPTAEVLPIRS